MRYATPNRRSRYGLERRRRLIKCPRFTAPSRGVGGSPPPALSPAVATRPRQAAARPTGGARSHAAPPMRSSGPTQSPATKTSPGASATTGRGDPASRCPVGPFERDDAADADLPRPLVVAPARLDLVRDHLELGQSPSAVASAPGSYRITCSSSPPSSASRSGRKQCARLVVGRSSAEHEARRAAPAGGEDPRWRRPRVDGDRSRGRGTERGARPSQQPARGVGTPGGDHHRAAPRRPSHRARRPSVHRQRPRPPPSLSECPFHQVAGGRGGVERVDELRPAPVEVPSPPCNGERHLVDRGVRLNVMSVAHVRADPDERSRRGGGPRWSVPRGSSCAGTFTHPPRRGRRDPARRAAS